MTPKEKCEVYYTVDNEDFDYTFRSYSDFNYITDPEFHRLRKAYEQAADALEAYFDPTEEELEEYDGEYGY